MHVPHIIHRVTVAGAFASAVAAAALAQQESDLGKALKAGGKALTGPEIQALLVGSTHYYTPARGDVREGYVYIAPNGNGALMRAYNTGRRERANISLRVEGSKACWFSATNPVPNCLSVLREGSLHRQYREDGALVNTITAAKLGNPENL